MSTTINRGATWTNSDGLVVGYGPNKTVVEGAPMENDGGVGGVKNAAVTFSYKDTGVNVPVPAGSIILEVKLVVGTAWAGGTAVEVGDGSSATGFITATAGAVANLTAGAVIGADGAYAFGATDTGARELHSYASADTIDVAYSGTFTAGDATLVVSYI